MTISKRYTIKFSYAGITQYADFGESDGVLVCPRLSVNYSKEGEIPDVSNCKTIDEVLKLIKSFSNRAEISSINGMPVFYYKKPKTQELIKEIKAETERFIENLAFKFFDAEIKPLLIKNKWFVGRSWMVGMFVLIEKDEKGEWDNVRKEREEGEFKYLCERFLSAVNIKSERFPESCFLSLVEEKLKEFIIEDLQNTE